MALNDKDLNLKLYISVLFNKLGYTVFQEVDLCTYSYQPKYTRKQITDFDVIGVKIEGDFGIQIAVAECKSVEEKAMENLLKLNGIKEFFKAEKAYFVQKKIDINAREIGRELGIWVLDERNLNTLMESVGVSEKKYFQLEKQIYTAKAKMLESQKSDLSKITDYLRYDFWTLPDNRNIINILRLIQQISDKLEINNETHVILLHQIATNLSFSIIRLTAEIIKHNINEIPDGSLTRMLGGPRERRDREALFDTISKVVSDSRLTYIPPFQDSLNELIVRFVNASYSASKVVSCLDHLTRYSLISQVNELYGTPESIYGDRTLKLSRDVIYFLINQTGISKELFKKTLTDGNYEAIQPSAQPDGLSPAG